MEWRIREFSLVHELLTIREGGYTAVRMVDVGSMSSGCVWVAPARPAAPSAHPGSVEIIPAFLLAVRLACLLLLILRFLGGIEEGGAGNEP